MNVMLYFHAGWGVGAGHMMRMYTLGIALLDQSAVDRIVFISPCRKSLGTLSGRCPEASFLHLEPSRNMSDRPRYTLRDLVLTSGLMSSGDILVADTKESLILLHLDDIRRAGIHVVLVDRYDATDEHASALLFPNDHTPSQIPALRQRFTGPIWHGASYVMLAPDIIDLSLPLQRYPQTFAPFAPEIAFLAGAADVDALIRLEHATRGLSVGVIQKHTPFTRVFYVGRDMQGGFPCAGCDRNILVTGWNWGRIRRASLCVTMLGQTFYEVLYYGIPTVVVGRTRADGPDADFIYPGARLGGYLEAPDFDEQCADVVGDLWLNAPRRRIMHDDAVRTAGRLFVQGAKHVASTLVRFATSE